ncbi:DNA polymerase III subunit beta [Moraxella macacae 0408225]|uniref:Beta sliding clamp n=1 Tax=Moraxella macacae 0408225 TaxID=1230338 RepID=L2F821_9GAMM|nr:DNA polymerase III subunit beta [Moraxella macacae]ELA09214.1 DNA polymerase III subunit beta [Moraxella macacae 0408225]
MQLVMSRDVLLHAVNLISKASDKRHNMAILGNLKLELTEQQLVMTASDLEVELQSTLNLPKGACRQAGQITIPANKFKDIVKLLPEETVSLTVGDDLQCVIKSGKSTFKLGTLPAEDFPMLGEPEQVTPVQISRVVLSDLMEKTHFAMAVQDVRYYLTGMLFELKDNQLATVATDGHRLALARTAIEQPDGAELNAILPRKAVLELQRLLGELKKLLPQHDNQITLNVGRDFLQVILPFGEIDSDGQMQNPILVAFTARLIDGKFPDYRRVMPNNTDKLAYIKQEQLVTVLRRVSLLSHEKTRGVVFYFADSENLEVKTSNSEHDEACEQLTVNYQGDPLEISFNVAYLLDVLNTLGGDIELHMGHANGSVLIRQVGDDLHEFVVMPMRL